MLAACAAVRGQDRFGSAVAEIIILEFPTYEDATLWYRSPEYQAAGQHRFQGGDYRRIISEGLPT
jgi:uncharacterized protein (DUF1330 family)